jgi:hypothetical protein
VAKRGLLLGLGRGRQLHGACNGSSIPRAGDQLPATLARASADREIASGSSKDEGASAARKSGDAPRHAQGIPKQAPPSGNARGRRPPRQSLDAHSPTRSVGRQPRSRGFVSMSDSFLGDAAALLHLPAPQPAAPALPSDTDAPTSAGVSPTAGRSTRSVIEQRTFRASTSVKSQDEMLQEGAGRWGWQNPGVQRSAGRGQPASAGRPGSAQGHSRPGKGAQGRARLPEQDPQSTWLGPYVEARPHEVRNRAPQDSVSPWLLKRGQAAGNQEGDGSGKGKIKRTHRERVRLCLNTNENITSAGARARVRIALEDACPWSRASLWA